jgi:SAM-dependent methyltransferase
MSQFTSWQKEYQQAQGIPTSTRNKPSSALGRFLEFAQKNQLKLGRSVIDLGCGKGRNSLYLANLGFQVTALDFIPSVLDEVKNKAKKQYTNLKVQTVKANLSKSLPFSTGQFDWAIDIVSSVSLNLKEMKFFVSEVERVLKPKGIFLTYVHSRDDGYLGPRVDEAGFYQVPETGLMEHAWRKTELKQLYDEWQILTLDKIEKKDQFYGQTYTRRLWWLVARKS